MLLEPKLQVFMLFKALLDVVCGKRRLFRVFILRVADIRSLRHHQLNDDTVFSRLLEDLPINADLRGSPNILIELDRCLRDQQVGMRSSES